MITGRMLRDAFISASHNINNNRKSVDELNIFPVPDGDTGTNMSMTMSAAARELRICEDNVSADEIAEKAAGALLRGARGNSGVILSLIFRGFARGLKGRQTANAHDLAAALGLGVEAAYNAVMKPTEGTILTVVRVAAENAKTAAQQEESAVSVWRTVCESAQRALAQTPELLPVLKDAGVVDAGGQGLLLIFKGMLSVFETDTIIPSDGTDPTPGGSSGSKEIVANAGGDIRFAYCSEFLIQREHGNTREPLRLRAYLESIGDCVVVVDDGDIIKVHVHSNEPGNVIQAALAYGQLTNIKIDNMRQQHTNAGLTGADGGQTAPAAKAFGFVAVAAGDGMTQLLADLGVDQTVSGGQTMNPSTDDLLRAIERVNAQHVFVLPNNKNIIMAAEQAIPLSKKTVSVLHTKTIPQGIAALLAFDESLTGEENHIAMMKAAERVSTGQITFAARDSSIDGKAVKQGEILGLENGRIAVVDSDTTHAAYHVARHLFKKGKSMITLYYGQDVTEQDAQQVQALLEAKLGGDAEIAVINGGQPVYYYLISVE